MLWENLTFKSNTSENTLPRAVEYILEHLNPSVPELPVKGAPTSFVPDDWDRYVFVRQRRTRKILSINKNMYELCLVEQLIDQIIAGEIYVVDSQYYSSLEEWLISTEEFTQKREYYLEKFLLPLTSEEFVSQLSEQLSGLLNEMNHNYEIFSPYTQ